MTMLTAGILIIGDEVLSGRTQDTNTSTLAIWLNSIGVKVGEVRVIADIEENFYFKDQNNQIFASPADEKPSYPHDCFPDDLDVAIGIDRIQKATIFQFHKIEHKWSGLRTFVSDKSPVVGFENDKKNFFWLVGQGGYGIQTAPALAEISADLILDKKNKFFDNQSSMYNISIERIRYSHKFFVTYHIKIIVIFCGNFNLKPLITINPWYV